MPERAQPILVVEDSPEDFEATSRAFRRAGLRNPMLHCATGDDALDFLHRRGRYEDPRQSPRPGVILLDLNLPGTDGREVLHEIKRSDDLAAIPVIVLTTSSDARDVDACYQAGASSYIQKPVDLDGFMRAIQRLHDYWFEVVVLPRLT
jgi:CheY-like chemotaxis protein